LKYNLKCEIPRRSAGIPFDRLNQPTDGNAIEVSQVGASMALCPRTTRIPVALGVHATTTIPAFVSLEPAKNDVYKGNVDLLILLTILQPMFRCGEATVFRTTATRSNRLSKFCP
jgi:hypothetical protein